MQRILTSRLGSTPVRSSRHAAAGSVSAVAQTRARVQESRNGHASTSGRTETAHHASGHRQLGGALQEHLAVVTQMVTGQRDQTTAPQHHAEVQNRSADRLQATEDIVRTMAGDRPQSAGGPLAGTPPGDEDEENSLTTKLALGAAPVALALGLLALAGGGYAFRDQISVFVDYFIQLVEEWGPGGFVAYGLVYTLLEVLALPAIPLTMTAGIIFGVVPGTAIVSVSATAAAAISFLIARYLAREKVAAFANKNPKFKAIDAAIGRNGFKVVTLLRMSPLLPLAASSYLYGLTSVDLPSYVLGSWLGMLPGTIAYVAAGSYGRALLGGEGEGLGLPSWQVAVGAGVTLLSLLYIGRLAASAVEEEERRAGSDDP